jgi:uncharacterized protein YbjT (DUF2867 family)
MMRRTILVTGATGRVGGQVAARLAAREDVRVKALSRRPGATVPGAEVVAGDLADPNSLDLASLDVTEVDAVFLVFPSIRADAAARDLIRALTAAPRRIVYLSAHGVPETPDPAAEPDGGILGSHAHLEALIARSGAAHTFLRSSGFAANTLGWADQLRRSDTLRWIFPKARRALVHEADLADVAVRALTEDGHPAAYHLTGPEQLTQDEQLAALGRALGRDLRFEELDPATAAAELFPGFPPSAVQSIIGGQAAMADHPEPRTDTIAQITGRPARTYADWARDHVADFALR